MDFQRGRVGKPTGSGPGTIHGEMLLDSTLEADGVGINSVMFTPGSRTDWHSHTGGQVFFITYGHGMVATRDGDYKAVQAGDVVYAPPGEVHWHGAAPDAYVVYSAVSLGRSEWLDPVTDESYGEAWDGQS
jgi:quercetin dioxygenase-like cupin family protein